ncbi:MAG: hypothetical protein VXZ82_25345 [Planctomycetota bacterium]|nr:hypothetical protein [Planctomycetota bacterium]
MAGFAAGGLGSGGEDGGTGTGGGTWLPRGFSIVPESCDKLTTNPLEKEKVSRVPSFT